MRLQLTNQYYTLRINWIVWDCSWSIIILFSSKTSDKIIPKSVIHVFNFSIFFTNTTKQVIISTVLFIDSESAGFGYYELNLDLDHRWTQLHKTIIHGYPKVSCNVQLKKSVLIVIGEYNDQYNIPHIRNNSKMH